VSWNDIAILIGTCAALGGAIATIFYSRRWWLPSSTTHLTTNVRLESMGELCAAALFWGGIVLGQAGTIADEIQRGASHQRLAFTLAVTALLILVCGVTLGRLSLRLQLKLEPAIRATRVERVAL
jgi:hypothetical protein